jgi:uncharacterized protein (DUF1015 family)
LTAIGVHAPTAVPTVEGRQPAAMPSPLIQPFCAIRPDPARAADVAARPYDVVTLEEARSQAAGRPDSFLHVSRAEIDCPPGTDPYAPEVYARAARALSRMLDDGTLVREARPCLYVYRMTAGTHVQTGLAAAASIAAYESGRIRRHELTRPDKELDRTRQIAAVAAHTGPVLVAHPPSPMLSRLLDAGMRGPCIADAVTVDGTRHQVWPVTAPEAIAALIDGFETFDAVYIADGHHRSAAAARLARETGRSGRDGRFLIVSFPADALRVLDYNRIVRDLGDRTPQQFLAALADAFEVEPAGRPARPKARATFTMFLDGRWYRLRLRRPPSASGSARERLDVSLLSDRLLQPILGINDPRTDPRIDFVGGGRGLAELEHRVRSGEWAVAFALFPTAFEDVVAVADAGDVMPPKSTWFEPKLADGLLSLPLDQAV